jgi:hypothetical protein
MDVGPAVVAEYAKRESAVNLQPFVPTSPVRNLEAFAYGAGLGSIAGIIALVWLLRDRPRFGPGWWTVLGWVGVGFVLYSIAGTGTQRYVLPVVPGVALLGGMWFAAALRDFPRLRGRLAWGAGVLVGLLAVGQGLWYGYARNEAGFDVRSPRAFLAELLARPDVDPDRLAAFGFWTGGLDYAAGQPVEPFGDPALPRAWSIPQGVPMIDELKAEMRRRGGAWTLLIREDPDPDAPTTTPPIERLPVLGFEVEPIPVEAEYMIDEASNRVRAVRVRLEGE